MVLLGQKGGQHPLAALVDHAQTYGPDVIERFVGQLHGIDSALDIGAGLGRDLRAIKRAHKGIHTIAIEAGTDYAKQLRGVADEVHTLDIEREPLPLGNASVDLIVANQILEHTKEVFWIFHEMARTTRIGGHIILGVPNVASWHNRVLLLFGRHPTQHKLCSAHVRPFSKADTLRFLEACFPRGFRLASFAGAQFYPFPSFVAKAMAKCFPTGAFSIFFLLQKVRSYTDEFVTYPARARLETNFWTGAITTHSQYARI